MAGETQAAPLPMAGRLYLPEVIFSLMIVGTLFVNLGPANLAPIDLLLVVVLLAYVPMILRLRNDLMRRTLIVFGIPVSIYVGLGLLLLVVAGGTGIMLLKDAFSFLYLFVGLALLLLVQRQPTLALPKLALITSLLLLFVEVARQAGFGRAEGTFANPNSAGSWFGSAFILLLVLRYPVRRILRWCLIAVALAGVVLTGSLGFILASFVAAAFLLVSRTRLPAFYQLILVGALGVLVIRLLPWFERLTVPGATEGGRFARSSSGRSYLWSEAYKSWLESPWGQGPGGFAESRRVVLSINGAEAHNDYLGVLVDYGAVGLVVWLVALVGLFVVAGSARPMVVFIAASGLTHSTLNYRNQWLFLALAMAAGYWAGRSRPPDGHQGLEEVEGALPHESRSELVLGPQAARATHP